MKKKWVELRRGHVVELTAMRSVSTGVGLKDEREGRHLYIKYVGDRTSTSILFASVEEKWAAYDAVMAAVNELNKAENK